MAELNVVILQNEIRKLKISEQMKRREYAQMQDNVQDTWDKLVNLRSHIALFNSAIEEVRIEEATYYANSSLSSMDSNDLTSDMATRLSSLHALREKVRLKEGLKAKVTLMEEQLIVLRKKLSDQAEYLSKTSNSMIADASGSASKETLVTLNEHRLEDSMSARTALLISSRKLEDFESEYLQNVSELELVELEISEVMKWNPDLEKEASSNTDDLSPPKTPPRTSKDIPMTPSTYCPISLHEVLSGQARVTRINGEDASKYRVRLEKRVAGLKILDEQLNKELNQKNADLLKIKSLLKDVELQRLRKEVELNNLEKHIEDAVSGVDISSPLPESAVELENVTESPLKKSQSEKNINMAIQMLGQDLMQNVVMPSSIKRTSDSTNMNVTVGFEGDAPFTPCTNVSDTKEQTSPADVSMRLEKLAKNLEDSSELAVGQKELLQTVQKQQKDLETLRVAQANLLKLITGKELSQSGITELSDCASPETDSDPRTIPNTSSSAALMLNDSISSISMPVAHENEGAGDLRRNSPGAQSPAHVSTTEIYQELQSTLAVDKTVSDAFKTPIKEMLVAKKPCPINTTPREAATSGVSLPILDDETASILVFDNTYMNLLRKVNNCREKLTEAQAKEFIDKHTGTVFDPITAKSTSFVEVGVISARELPITKKFNNSSDPFIELFLVKKHETSSSSPSVGIQNNRTFSTKVLHTNIRPQWRETFKFTELLPPCTESADTAEDENPLEELLLFLLLMDHNKSAAPEIVGECSVSLKDFLDQEKHTVWINVKPPG